MRRASFVAASARPIEDTDVAKKKSAISPELIKANLKHQAKAALKSANRQHGHDVDDVHGPRGPPCLLDRHEVCALLNLTYPTVWKMMRRGEFPRSRIVGGQKSMWLSSEITEWMNKLPTRPLKGDEATA